METSILEKQKEILHEWAELLKMMKDWLDLGTFKSEVMAELNVAAFEDLPQSIRKFIAIRLNALVPVKQIAARRAALEKLSGEIVSEEIASLPGWQDCVN
jgi:hypothetical protein